MLPKQIHIPTPCHEDWNKMSPTEKGAFCQKCNKEVFDFTNSSSRDIKSILEKNESTCGKITNHKLNELNFLEWLNHLTLKKRLKYVFLFALLIAQNRLMAQESKCYEPQFVALDSSDEISIQEIVEEIEFYLIEETPIYDWLWNPDIMIHWQPQEPYGLIVCEVMGGMQILPEAPDFPIYLGLMTENSEFKTPIKSANALVLGDNKYAFDIIEDELHFSTESFRTHEITLNISQDQYGSGTYPNNHKIFFGPIIIEKGQNTLIIPLDHLINGIYTVKITHNQLHDMGSLIYW